MYKSTKLTTAFIAGLPPNSTSSKSADYEVNLSGMKGSVLPTGVRCLVGKSGGKRFLLRYISPVTGKKAAIGLGKFPETDLVSLAAIAIEYRLKIASGIDPKIERDNAAPNCSMTLAQFFDDVYLPLAKQKRSWLDDVARFRHAKIIQHVPIGELTAAHIIKVQMLMQETICTITGKPYAVATCNRVLALLKSVNRLAYKLLDAPLVADKVSLLKEDNIRTGYLSEPQLKEFVAHALEYHDKHIGSFLALLFLTGLRDSELRLRKWADVDFDNKTLAIPHTKNGSSHVIYLSDFMVGILDGIPRVTRNPFIFAGNKLGKPISPARYALSFIKAKMGLPDIPRDKNNITLHSARHTVGSLLASRGVPLHDIAKQLNHADLSSTRRYSKLTVGRRREIGTQLSDLVSS